jgi:glycosyltransferase involved in cell wall biosynthesis
MRAVQDASASASAEAAESVGPGLTVIIPANNEEAYLARCLEALMASEPADCPVQVLVVANACTDRTVEVARSFVPAAARLGWTLQVIDLATPGKLHALNVGDDQARGEHRLYLDADVLVSPPLIRLIVAELAAATGACYASGRPRIAPARSAVTRAYARFWQQLPFARSVAPGFGLFAVNAAGRRRWDRFPSIISDDTYVTAPVRPARAAGGPSRLRVADDRRLRPSGEGPAKAGPWRQGNRPEMAGNPRQRRQAGALVEAAASSGCP